MQESNSPQVWVDLRSSRRTHLVPLAELTTLTGVSWMLIGYVDAHGFEPSAHNLLVCIWAILVLWRFVVPVLKQNRRRILLTDEGLLLRDAGFRAPTEFIPLAAIHQVRRHRGGLQLAVHGVPTMIYLPQVPKAKKVAQCIETAIAQRAV